MSSLATLITLAIGCFFFYRFAREADWIHVLIFYTAASLRGKGAIFKSAMRIPRLVNHIDDLEVRAEVKNVLVKMHFVVTWHIYRRSLVLIPIVPVLAVLVALATLSIKTFIRAPKRIEALMNARAYSIL